MDDVKRKSALKGIIGWLILAAFAFSLHRGIMSGERNAAWVVASVVTARLGCTYPPHIPYMDWLLSLIPNFLKGVFTPEKMVALVSFLIAVYCFRKALPKIAAGIAEGDVMGGARALGYRYWAVGIAAMVVCIISMTSPRIMNASMECRSPLLLCTKTKSDPIGDAMNDAGPSGLNKP